MSRRRAGAFTLVACLAAAAAAAGLLVLVLVLWPQPPPETLVVRSSRQCLACHADVAREWEGSHHALAFRNPEVRKLSLDFQNEECLACHAPRPVLGFRPGERVLARQGDRGLGVDCLACHLVPETGQVATANPDPNPDAPCRPVAVPRLAAVDFCGSCHNQHGTVDQWENSAPELKGRGCLDCHMPEVWRAGGRRGRGHATPGAHDLGTLQQAVVLEAGWTRAGPWAALSNRGAAHNFPTDERSRAADLQVRWRTPEGWSEWSLLRRMRDPYRDEVDLTNTQLPSGATWRQQLDAPADAVQAEVRLLYRTNPFQPDDEAAQVARARIQP